jgi:osmotically-inducible protein OsmY
MNQEPLEFAEVLKFRFGADVQASDGEAGKLNSVVADEQRRAITHVGVKVGGLFTGGGRIYFVALELVTESNGDAVTLSIPLEEIQKHTATPSGLALTSATTVGASGKSLGRLAQLTINAETRALRQLVVERGLREVLVPARMITDITGRQIAVNLGNLSADKLASFRPDAELHQEIYDRLYDYVPMRIDLPGIQIHAIDGAVWLQGYISSDVKRRLAEDQLTGVPGMSELHNDLIADNELSAAVSMALAHDPRTAQQRIGVYPRLGDIYLRGNVHTTAALAAASEIARAVPGVKDLYNELRVNPTADVVPVLAGVTNNEDLVPGGR